MAPHYVQAFLDHANLSTTSRYPNITSQGMHSAMKRVEAERGIRCTAVALAPIPSIEVVPVEAGKSMQ
jgi:hypothetical protein